MISSWCDLGLISKLLKFDLLEESGYSLVNSVYYFLSFFIFFLYLSSQLVFYIILSHYFKAESSVYTKI